MADYAVVDPATGETSRSTRRSATPTLADAIATRRSARTASGRARRRSRSAPRSSAASASCTPSVARSSREIIVREMGKPVEQALGEVDFCAAIYEYYADNATQLLADEPIDAARRATARRSSGAAPSASCSGSCRGTTPTTRWRASPARTSSSATRSCSSTRRSARSRPRRSSRSSDDAGFPAGAYTNIYATNDQIADVIADPRVQGVSVTGSERAGAAVAEIAGRNLKKVVLELGGSDPFILLSTDDLDAVVESAVAARLENAGQACNAAKRFVVARRPLRAVRRAS